MEELPEWKKEFLERRKNLSKTSNGSTPNSSPKKKVELATSPVETSPHTSPKKYSHQPIGSTYSAALVGHSLLNQSPHSHTSAAHSVSKSLYSQYAQQPQNEHHESENVRNQVEVYSRSGSCGNNNVKNLLPSKINNSKKYESNNNFDVIKSSFNKFQTSESSENNFKKSNKTSANKMVAAGEIINEQQMNQFDSDEASEELKYGPGIVSKLRCRYLSLTLRQATVKQRPTINNLRRTTSLNNLLDEDEEDDGDDDEHHNGNKIQDHHEKHIIGKYVRCVSENYKNGDENLKLKNTEIYHNQRNSRSNEKSSENRLKNRHDSMKRARSVEAILRSDHHSWDRDVQKENNMNRMSQEYVGFKNREVTIEDKIINARERNDPKPKRLPSLIDEDERPPPDVVKQTMLIFESNANKKRNSVTRPIGSEVAAKVATFKTIISQEKPAVVFPKPTINAKKPNIIPRTTSPKPIISNMKNNNSVNINNNCAKFVKEKPVLPKLDINIIKNNLETKTNGVTSPTTNGNKNNLLQNVNSDYRISKDLSATSGSESPMSTPNILSPFRNSMTPSPQFDVNAGTRKIGATNGTVVDSPMSLLSNKLNNIHLMESSTPKNIVQTVQPKINTKTDDSESDIDESDEGNSSDSSDKIKVKRISQTALENISKAGTTQQFKFTNNTNNLSNNNSNNINNSNSISNDCNIKQLPVSNNSVNNISEPVAPEKQVKIINSEVESSETVKSVREIKAPSVPPPLPPIASARSLLTTREIEKNSINKEKDLNEAPVVPPRESKIAGASSASASASSSSANANAGAVASTAVSSSNPPKWSAKKKNWNQEPENNTMVFNFSDRKDVPDYIENDGLILRRKRELPKPNESGFIFLGDMVLETSTDPDDAYQMGPPSPCDVEFENANIIIDGKSSIRTRVREVKSKIKFDDSLTATFEYPSENSMMIDDFLEWDVESDYMKTQSGSPSKLLTSVPLGSAPFANYTPTKGSSASASFELGVTKAPSPSTSDSTDSIEDQPENIQACVNGENSEYLKPASDDQTVMWSEGTRATDLLF